MLVRLVLEPEGARLKLKILVPKLSQEARLIILDGGQRAQITRMKHYISSKMKSS
jgi:hypothetical protein